MPSAITRVRWTLWLSSAVSAMLPDGADLGDVRDWQCRHLFRKIEEFNVDFSLPVILGASIGEGATSPLYHLISQGYAKVVPKSPEAPGAPAVDVLSMASCRVSWNPPDQGDGPMQRYRVDRMAGALPGRVTPLL